MRRIYIQVLADDLTGAAEIAAIGHRLGQRATVVIKSAKDGAAGGFTVVDTETRLAAPAGAARAVSAAARNLVRDASTLVYKKVDSVLRGSVAAEVSAAARSLGRRTVLLVPNNPGQGRVVRAGRYLIGNVPLERTAFRRDPHHPARTSLVCGLMGRRARATVVTLAGPRALPSGIVIGESATGADLAAWAARVDESVLPAGGAEFFAALAAARGWVRGPGKSARPIFAGPTLWICGTTAPGASRALDRGKKSGGRLFRAVAFARPEMIAAVAGAALAAGCFTIVASTRRMHRSPEAAAWIARRLERIAGKLVRSDVCRHVMIEGGSTAAAIMRTAGWRRLVVVYEWAPGVVTLRPAHRRNVLITIKPGSYEWPEVLWRSILLPR